MLELFRKYRLRLLAGSLVLAALLFYSANLRHQNNTTLFEKVVLQIAAPLLYSFDSTCRTADGLWNRYLWLINTETQNEILRTENRRLQNELTDLQEVRLANQRLRKLLDFREDSGFSGVAARIIAVDAGSLFRTVIIDKGSKHGLREGLPVVVAEGAVGRIVKCTPRQSRVLLVTDASSSVAALAQRSRTRAICRGQGDYLTLEFALRRDDIAIGDHIITSGTGGTFPKGLVLGRVSDIEREAYSLFQTVTVIPEVDFNRLEEVLVLQEKAP
jgi:rod shape-determining protein MreC